MGCKQSIVLVRVQKPFKAVPSFDPFLVHRQGEYFSVMNFLLVCTSSECVKLAYLCAMNSEDRFIDVQHLSAYVTNSDKHAFLSYNQTV